MDQIPAPPPPEDQAPPPPPPPPEEAEGHFESIPPPPPEEQTDEGQPPPPPPPPPPEGVNEHDVAPSPPPPPPMEPSSVAPPPPPPPSSARGPDTSSQAPIASTSQLPEDPKEMDRLLSIESTAFFRELEIDRILSSFKLNPYDVLEVSMEADTKELNKVYRKKSLLIHPDKVRRGTSGDDDDDGAAGSSNKKSLYERAVEAFDLLKKASTHLLDEEKRKTLDETVISARFLVLKEQFNLPTTTDPKTSPILQSCQPPFEERVRAQTKELMIDDELRKRKMNKLRHKMEGEEERKKEEEMKARKRKAEEKERWEETRDERVAGWRAFANGSAGKKKKKKSNVLG